MLLDINKLKEIYKKALMKSSKNKTTGSIIRSQRMSQNMTLDEATEGICSISYLSKIENGEITANPMILIQLAERLNINEDRMGRSENIKEALEKIMESILLCKKLSTLYYVANKDKLDYRSKLITYAYYVTNAKYINAYECYEKLMVDIEKLSLSELDIFLILTSIYLRKNSRAIEALKINYVMSHPKEEKTNYTWNREIYFNSTITNYHPGIKEVENKLINDSYWNNYHLIDGLRMIKQLTAISLCCKGNIEYAMNNSNFRPNEIRTIKAAYYLRLDNPEEALKFIDKTFRNDKYQYIIYLLSLDRLQKKEEILDIINHHDEKHNLNEIKVIKEILKIKYTTEPEQFYRYLIIDYKNEYYKPLQIPVISDEIFISASKYFYDLRLYKISANLSQLIHRNCYQNIK